MTERIVRPGEFYRHFKNKLYQIVAVAKHSETGERMVVYQALYGDFGVYVRPYDMFTSEVDHEKYPQVSQKWRFERVEFGVPEKQNAEACETEQSFGTCAEQRAAQAFGQKSAGWNAALPETQKNTVMPETNQKITQHYADRTPDPVFLQFLDTEDFDLRMECLKQLENRITQQELDSMYLVLDMKPERGSLQEQLYAVRRFLTMQKRYDGSRLR